MKEKLIKLLQEWGNKENDGIKAESIANYLIENDVIVPPCKVGDIVYVPIITDDKHEFIIWKVKLTCVDVCNNEKGSCDFCVGIICGGNSGYSFKFEDIGKTVFLTREEAERALKEGGKG